jgi:hypothetical protein
LHCFVPHLHTVSSCVRSGLCIHNTASFRYTLQATFHYIPAVLCLPPLVFSAVAPSHSHRGWLRSVKTSLCPKSGNAKGCLIFFPRRFTLISATFRFVPTLNSRIYGSCSIAATPPTSLLIHSATIPLSLHFSSIPCGAWGCLIADSTRNIPEK